LTILAKVDYTADFPGDFKLQKAEKNTEKCRKKPKNAEKCRKMPPFLTNYFLHKTTESSNSGFYFSVSFC
jgi:hypothetical protein